jgi:hypothetical protein
VSKLDFRDWFILLHVNAVCDAIVWLMFKFHTDLIVGAGCAALPTILGLYHWFVLRDSKTADAGGQ